MIDVIIIGAGPTGATAAKVLAESNLKVLVVERMKLPRYKSCSGMLIKKTVDLVKRYFREDIPRSVMCTPTENCGMVFTDDKGKKFVFEQSGLNVWRSKFDYWLFEKAIAAGAELRDETVAISCEQDDKTVKVKLHSDKEYIVEAKYVIDCEGVTGTFKRNVLGKAPEVITTFQTFNEGSIDLDPHYFYAYLQPELSEYDAWFNVKDDMLVLGVAVRDTSTIDHYYETFLRYLEENYNLKIKKTMKWERWLLPYIRKGFSIDYGKGRVLFAGEVAGFLNPMGEGISAGLESGYTAAQASINNFATPAAVIDGYRESTKLLREYMERQWGLVRKLVGAVL